MTGDTLTTSIAEAETEIKKSNSIERVTWNERLAELNLEKAIRVADYFGVLEL